MSDPEKPKDAQDAPKESPTQAFRLKMSEWMNEIKQDFGLPDAPTTESAPTEEEAKPAATPAAPAPPRPPAAPPRPPSKR